VELVPASAPTFFLEDTPTATLVRQVLGAISQFEKTSLVAKLKAARDRKKAVTGKCGGRKSLGERDPENGGEGQAVAPSPAEGRPA
jgi:DNA invertase Pin-like site-specific DNA recombinase